MLEIYGIVLPWIRWAQRKGLKKELQQIVLHGIIRYMDWTWLNTKGRGVKPCEMYSRGMKQHTIRILSFFLGLCLGDAEVEKEWLVTLATINPSEVEYEDPFCFFRVTLGTTICSRTGRTLCLVHGDWPSNWRSRPLEDVTVWGQGLLLNSWHLSQSPTNPGFVISKYFEATSILSNDPTPKSIMENHTKSWKSKPSQVIKTSECTSSSSHRKPFNMDNECKFMKQNHTERLSSLLLFAPGSLIPGARPFSPQPSAQANGCDLPRKWWVQTTAIHRRCSEKWKVTRKGITNPVVFCDVRERHPKKSFVQRGIQYIVHSNAYLNAFRDNVWSTLNGLPLKVRWLNPQVLGITLHTTHKYT